MAYDKTASPQVAKFVNAKQGTTKVLALSASFQGEDRNKGPLEMSALHRFIVEAHQVTGSGNAKESITLTGNLPIEEFNVLYKNSDDVRREKLLNGQVQQATLLPGVWKPKMSTKDEDGTVEVYCVEVNYNGAMSLPIQFKISTLRAPLSEDASGRLNPQLKKTIPGSKQEIVFYISATQWFSQLDHAAEVYRLFLQRSLQLGTYDKALGFAGPES